jgi:hypothetical protein
MVIETFTQDELDQILASAAALQEQERVLGDLEARRLANDEVTALVPTGGLNLVRARTYLLEMAAGIGVQHIERALALRQPSLIRRLEIIERLGVTPSSQKLREDFLNFLSKASLSLGRDLQTNLNLGIKIYKRFRESDCNFSYNVHGNRTGFGFAFFGLNNSWDGNFVDSVGIRYSGLFSSIVRYFNSEVPLGTVDLPLTYEFEKGYFCPCKFYGSDLEGLRTFKIGMEVNGIDPRFYEVLEKPLMELEEYLRGLNRLGQVSKFFSYDVGKNSF